jgi:hypothetical protein
MQRINYINYDERQFRLKIKSVSVCCLPCPPHQGYATLSKAVLVVVVILLLSLPPLLLLLPSSLLLPGLSLLSLSSCCLPNQLLPLPPITASTQSPQSSAAASPSSIAAVIDVQCTCHHRPPSPPSNANARYCHPPPPMSNAIFAIVTLPPPSNATKHCHHDHTHPLTAPVIHYHHQTPPSIAPPAMQPRRRCSSLPSNANACYEHLPPLYADTHNYDVRGCDATADPCTAISLSLDADDVFQGRCVACTIVIGCDAPPSVPTPHCLPSPPPALIDC